MQINVLWSEEFPVCSHAENKQQKKKIEVRFVMCEYAKAIVEKGRIDSVNTVFVWSTLPLTKN